MINPHGEQLLAGMDWASAGGGGGQENQYFLMCVGGGGGSFCSLYGLCSPCGTLFWPFHMGGGGGGGCFFGLATPYNFLQSPMVTSNIPRISQALAILA